jgi:hypothetical protein
MTICMNRDGLGPWLDSGDRPELPPPRCAVIPVAATGGKLAKSADGPLVACAFKRLHVGEPAAVVDGAMAVLPHGRTDGHDWPSAATRHPRYSRLESPEPPTGHRQRPRKTHSGGHERFYTATSMGARAHRQSRSSP